MTLNVAVVFPGQGSQSVGMLSDIAVEFVEVREVYTEASDILHQNLWQLVKEGPKQELDQTVNTQPALLTASFAIWQILRNRSNLTPTMLAGHSLGEYTALVCAGALSFAEAVKLVAARGQYMQSAVQEGTGAMAAIVGLTNEAVQTICEQAVQNTEEIAAIANYNSIGQVVIAGHTAPILRAIQLAKMQQAKLSMLIPVSVPSHCLLMKPAAEKLSVLLQTINFQTPTIPVINNVAVLPYQNRDEIRTRLIEQLYQPVRWVETIQQFVTSGVNQIIECGPGKILSGLNKRIDKNLQSIPTGDLAQLMQVLHHYEG